MWAKFDAEQKNVDNMIRLNFESARLTHPECRLVILTDMITPFNVNELQPDLPGPRIEVRTVVRMECTAFSVLLTCMFSRNVPICNWKSIMFEFCTFACRTSRFEAQHTANNSFMQFQIFIYL